MLALRKMSWPHFSALLLFVLVLAGCTLLDTTRHTPAPPPEAPDQVLFLQGLDQLTSSPRPEAFIRLEKDFPDSPWTVRAKTVGALSGKVQEAGREHQQAVKQLDECSVERARLQGDVRSLEEYTAKLKGLLGESGAAESLPPPR